MSAIYLGKQHRSLEYTYLFKLQVNQNLKLKIYDISQKCLFKQSFTGADLDFSEVSKELSQRNLIKIVSQLQHKRELTAFFPNSTLDFMKDIQEMIDQQRVQVAIHNEALEKYTCPITLGVFQEPVIDDHGHTFEKKAIQEHLTKDNKCPISREPIQSLIPNRFAQQIIEEVQKQDPIPTFALFKEENKKLCQTNLDLAIAYSSEKNYKEALSHYRKAFQYTKDWKNYKSLVDLFLQMGDVEKMQLACLYLIQYQLQANEPLEAIQMLEAYKDTFELRQTVKLLVKLYLSTDQQKKAVVFALESINQLGQDHLKEILWLYEQVLRIDPYQFEVYSLASQLVTDPNQRIHLLLKGASHAIEQGEYKVAQELCSQAEQSESFLDQLIQLNLFKEQGLTDRLKEKFLFLAKLYEQKGFINEQLKVYKLLSQLEYDKGYYDQIIACYQQLKKPGKLYQWYMNWLCISLEQKDWETAETVAEEALTLTEQKTVIYETLEEIYVNWQNHKLQDLWEKLGKSYLDDGHIEQAEKTYRKAYERFGTFNQALSLADILQQQGKISLSVAQYYEASTIALLEDKLERLDLCAKRIRKIDPKMSHLDSNQKMHLLTQSHLFILSQELQSTKRESELTILKLNTNIQTLASKLADLERKYKRIK